MRIGFIAVRTLSKKKRKRKYPALYMPMFYLEKGDLLKKNILSNLEN